jgi:hypothetical protein
MQEREFENLLAGKPSKWADIPTGMPLSKVTKNFVEQNEKPVPTPVVSAVDIWVDRCQKLGMSEKNIRKSVLKRFNIKLVK